jgi:hypothetical protein
MTATAEKLKLIQDTIGRMTDAEIIAGVHDWRVSGPGYSWAVAVPVSMSAFGGKADGLNAIPNVACDPS